MSRKLRAKTLGGVVCVCAEPVEKGAVCVERLFDSGVEQLFLALEVVVERAHSHVGDLGDLHDRRVGLPDGQQGLCPADQRGARLLLAPLLTAAGGTAGLGHCSHLPLAITRSVPDLINPEEIIRNP